MMEKEKLRKADIFSGGIISLVGIWIISQSLEMPMKDSWGGVQNVWFVSPAIFPLLVGTMITLLGALLIRTALKEVGLAGCAQVIRWLGSSELKVFLKTAGMMRFYAMVVLLFGFVYLNIPRIDFFLCGVLFLMAFITMFYFDDDVLLGKLFRFYLVGTLIFIALFIFRIPSFIDPAVPYSADWLTMIFIAAYILYTRGLLRNAPPLLRKKFKISLILSFAAPFSIGSIFKYLLLVPMPHEGLIVVVMDAVRYWDF